MYLYDTPSHREGRILFHGLSDDPSQQFDKSVASIKAALDLSPSGGYMKGSPARQKLDAGFESVPITFARELLDQLKEPQNTLGRLFRYRLHPATQLTMRTILERKSVEQQQKLLEAKQNLERVCRETAGKFAASQVQLNNLEKSLNNICKNLGEDSDQCQELRFKTLELRETLRAALRRRSLQCP